MTADKHKPWQNSEGYSDPTAYAALKPIIQKETDLDKKAHTVVNIVKAILDLAGFELVRRIEIRDIKTRKEFR